MSQASFKGRRKAGLSKAAVLVLGLLLILPGWVALDLRGAINLWYVAGYAVVVSGMTLLYYRHDKIRAQGGGWRVPESTLHLLELAGGWPGAFVAQRIFWHKVSKGSYQFVFWSIVVIYQYGCFDYLQDWHYSRGMLETVQHEWRSGKGPT